MPRKNHSQPRVRITFTTSEKVEHYLKDLVDLGCYGPTVPEAAEQIVCEQFRNDLRKKRSQLLNK